MGHALCVKKINISIKKNKSVNARTKTTNLIKEENVYNVPKIVFTIMDNVYVSTIISWTVKESAKNVTNQSNTHNVKKLSIKTCERKYHRGSIKDNQVKKFKREW